MSLHLRLEGASARKLWTSCSGWRGRVREVYVGAVWPAFARRWCSFLAKAASRAYAASLLALPAHSAAGVYGPPPLVGDVLADCGEPFAGRLTGAELASVTTAAKTSSVLLLIDDAPERRILSGLFKLSNVPSI